jgi:hypothetical protein
MVLDKFQMDISKIQPHSTIYFKGEKKIFVLKLNQSLSGHYEDQENKNGVSGIEPRMSNP